MLPAGDACNFAALATRLTRLARIARSRDDRLVTAIAQTLHLHESHEPWRLRAAAPSRGVGASPQRAQQQGRVGGAAGR